MEQEDESWDGEERSVFFDIRKYGFYNKLGGIGSFLKLAMKEGVRPYGNLIRKSDLAILINEHNLSHEEGQQIDVNEEGHIVWASENVTLIKEEVPISPLENSIMLTIEGYKDDKEAFKEVKEIVSKKEKPDVLSKYFEVMKNATYNPNDISLATSILQEMIDKKVNHFTKESLEGFLNATKHFIFKYKHLDMYETIEKTFEYMSTIDPKKFSVTSSDYLGNIHRRIGDLLFIEKPKYKEERISHAKKLADLQITAFYSFKRLGDIGRNKTSVRVSAWHYFQNMENLYLMSDTNAEKKNIVEESLNLCDELYDEKTPKDAVTYANANYFTSFFNLEKYRLTKDKGALEKSKRYFERVKSDLENIKNSEISRGLNYRIQNLDKKIKGVNKNG